MVVGFGIVRMALGAMVDGCRDSGELSLPCSCDCACGEEDAGEAQQG